MRKTSLHMHWHWGFLTGWGKGAVSVRCAVAVHSNILAVPAFCQPILRMAPIKWCHHPEGAVCRTHRRLVPAADHLSAAVQQLCSTIW